jgi:hypothetical protein
MSEAIAQVRSHQADAIRESWNELWSDRDLLVKLAEARQATSEESLPHPFDQVRNGEERVAAVQEILRKAALEGPVQPPRHAKFAVFLFPKSYQHVIFGDLEELYPTWLKECGRSKAAFLYWWQLVISTIQIAWPRTRRLRYFTALICLIMRMLINVHLSVGEILRHLR